jgi:hypothetical protein
MNAVVTAVVNQPEPREATYVTPLQILLRAIQDPSCDLVRLEKLIEIEAKWRAAINKEAYVRAFSQFKRNMPDIVTDMVNKQYDSDYSSLANLVNTTNKVLGEYGLNARWDIDQSSGIKITCIMTHEAGHSEQVVLLGPLDTTGQKNPLQQIKSTLTYLEGATFQALTGVVARSASLDDDGNASGLKTPAAAAAEAKSNAPGGYQAWSDNLRVIADEGKVRLLETWKTANMDYRVHMTKYEPARWAEMKRLAEKASQAVS